jgi:saccharopine dehydrogenase-like NADP-dependent oxidoreductase
VSVLPEFGMDPGIDLVMTAEAVRRFDAVTALHSYGAGIPEPAAADNPLRYKVSWSFEGVLRAYRRVARLVRDGEVVTLGPDEQFEPAHVHEVEVEGVGTLEAYPNGDAVRFAVELGLDPAGLRSAGRWSMRYPGHCAFWRTLVALHLLDDDPVVVDGVAVDRKAYLTAALGPWLRYDPGEGDLAILRNVVEGVRQGRRERLVAEVIARRDPATGLSAMSRLVGFTASIGAQMIGLGTIARRGLLSPTKNVPFALFAAELERRGITIAQEMTAQA